MTPFLLAAAFASHALAEGVTLMSDPGSTNALVVERSDGLLVVDSGADPDRGRALLAAIRERFAKPVRWLVLSHPHAGAWGGATAFPESAVVVASEGTRAALADPSYDAGVEERPRAGDPSAWKEPPRPRISLSLRGAATIDDLDRPVEIVPLPRTHTGGDVLVRIPAAGVVYVGDLVAPDATPWAGPDSRVAGWLPAVIDLSQAHETIFVGCRGGALDVLAVKRQRDAFAWTRAQVVEAYADLVPSRKISDVVLAAEGFPKFFGGDPALPFARSVVEAVIRDAREDRRKRGLPVD